MLSKNKSYKILILLGLVISILPSCKQSEQAAPTREVEINDQVPADFLNFYDRFHQDSSFQINRISFPLPQQKSGIPWDKERWILHKPFTNLGNEYLRSYANFEGIINERIIHKSGLFEMNRRFAKLSGDWHLIYYTIDQTEQSDWSEDSIQ